MLGHFENSFFPPLIKGFVSVSVASVLGWDQILHDGGREVSVLDGRAPCGSPGVPPVVTGSELCRRVEGLWQDMHWAGTSPGAAGEGVLGDKGLGLPGQ